MLGGFDFVTNFSFLIWRPINGNQWMPKVHNDRKFDHTGHMLLVSVHAHKLAVWSEFIFIEKLNSEFKISPEMEYILERWDLFWSKTNWEIWCSVHLCTFCKFRSSNMRKVLIIWYGKIFVEKIWIPWGLLGWLAFRLSSEKTCLNCGPNTCLVDKEGARYFWAVVLRVDDGYAAAGWRIVYCLIPMIPEIFV